MLAPTTCVHACTHQVHRCHAAAALSLLVVLGASLNQDDVADSLYGDGVTSGLGSLGTLGGLGLGDWAAAALWSVALWFCSPLQLLLLFLGRIDTERPSDWALRQIGLLSGQRCGTAGAPTSAACPHRGRTVIWMGAHEGVLEGPACPSASARSLLWTWHACRLHFALYAFITALAAHDCAGWMMRSMRCRWQCGCQRCCCLRSVGLVWPGPSRPVWGMPPGGPPCQTTFLIAPCRASPLPRAPPCSPPPCRRCLVAP